MRRLSSLVFVGLVACGEADESRVDVGWTEGPKVRLDSGVHNDDGLLTPDAGFKDSGVFVDAGTPPDGPLGFIGSPCATDLDCEDGAGQCLTDGYPRGMCSQSCARTCPDLDGHPITFCADSAQIEAAVLGDGTCVSRCDFGEFPGTGCRADYGCKTVTRPSSSVSQQVCLPGTGEPTVDCYTELAALGVDFEPTVMDDASPDSNPELTCHVEDPVYLKPPVLGVDIRYYDDSPSTRIRMACSMAKALAKTAEDLKAFDVVKILHLGAYNCRVIAGTDTLSRHGYGDAIDIYGLQLSDGTIYTVTDDWEDDTDMPLGEGGLFLYESVHRWHDDEIWSIILTPNYNAAHDNHFHVDLTPGRDFLRFLGTGTYLGPNPRGD